MERGFKSRCENMSMGLRRELNLALVDPLSPSVLAKFLDIPVLSLLDVPLVDSDDVHQLLVDDPDAWSAITVSDNGRDLIIVNPRHRGGRVASDVMHELAHILLGHEPSRMFFVGEEDIAMRGYSTTAEEEANWLAGTLLLPREALVHIRKTNMTDAEATNHYGISQAMLTYRFRMTGVNSQFARRRHRLT